MSDKHLPAHLIRQANVGGINHSFHFIELPPGYDFGDLFVAQFWGHYHNKLKEHDLIRVKAANGTFDVMLAIDSLPKGGIVMSLWPKYPGDAEPEVAKIARRQASASRPRTVPLDRSGDPMVKVEWTRASGWRVRGIDGHEVSRQHINEQNARDAMEKYLAELNLVMPDAATVDEAKSLAAIEAVKVEEKRQAKINKAKAPVV